MDKQNTHNAITAECPKKLRGGIYLQIRCVEAIPEAVEALVTGSVIDKNKENKITMGLHEALSNALCHGNFAIESEIKEVYGENEFTLAIKNHCCMGRTAGWITIWRYHDDSKIVWEVEDQGNGFDPQKALKNAYELILKDPPATHGRGLLMMVKFFDSVSWNEKGNKVVLTINR